MADLKLKKHKQSKFFTIMLVPYSAKKTASVRIPHWVFHTIFITAAVLISVVILSNLRTSFFRARADEINKDLAQVNELNIKLEEEKAGVVADYSQQQDYIEYQQKQHEQQISQQRSDYQKELEYYEEKAAELEAKIEEIDNAKNEIYDLLSQKAGSFTNINVSHTQPYEEENEAQVVFLSLAESFVPLDATYTDLEERLIAEQESFDNLIAEAKRIKPYLDSVPNAWPVWGKITSEVGVRANPFGGSGTESHSGIDISVPTGTSVKASGGGKVIHSGWDSGYGYLVTIDHGYGIVSMYGHNSKLLVNVGDYVQRGDVIAKSGSTGRSTGPHVHFEVRVNGVITNPRKYLS